MKSKWNFWNVTVLNGKKIVDLEDPTSRIAAEWLNAQLKSLEDPSKWFLERERGLLSWDVMSIEHFANSQRLRLEGITDANYRVECMVRSLMKDCISSLATHS